MAYTPTNWENLPSTNTPINSNRLNNIENGTANSNNAIGVNEYDNTATYNVGDYCIYDNKLYKCNTSILVAENWNAQHWDLTTVITEINNIVESGSNANGNYIKYADGTMICYAKFTANLSLDIAYNAVYRGDLQTVNFPETFIDNTYSVNVQGIAPVHSAYIGGRTKDNFTFYPIAFVSREAGIKEITYVAIGKWK